MTKANLGIFVVFIASSLVDLYTNKSKFFKWLSIVNLILFIRWVVFSKGVSAAGGNNLNLICFS